jgi:SPP1 gp7 family putative phage head morphogenesis protein
MPALQQAERETAAGLREWLRTVPNGDLRYTAQQRRNTLLHLRGAFRAIARLQPTMEAALRKLINGAGHLSAHHLQHEVARFSQVFEGTSRALPLNVARIIVQGERTLIPRIRTSAARYAGNVGQDIHRELAVGVLRGETVTDLTNRLVRHGGPRGLVALRGVAGEPGAVTEHIAEGLFTRYRYWATRIVRTETQNAYNEQLDEGFQQARESIPDLERRWDASIDGRVCQMCAGLNGVVVPIGQPFPDGIDGAPAHPNCRCRVGAWRADWTDILRDTGVQSPIIVRHVVPRTGATPAPPQVVRAPSPPPVTPPAASTAPVRASGGARAAGSTAAAAPLAPERPTGLTRLRAALANPRTSAEQRMVRREANAIVQSTGLVQQRRGTGSDSFSTYSRRVSGARGRTSQNGNLQMREDVHRNAVAFLDRYLGLVSGKATSQQENGFKTLLHETVHNHSPFAWSAYERAGAVVEEVTTETLARRLMRDQFGARGSLVGRTIRVNENRSYDRDIDATRRILEQQLGVKPSAAIRMIEDAALAMRTYHGPVIPVPDDYVRHFVTNLRLPKRFAGASAMQARMGIVTALKAAFP